MIIKNRQEYLMPDNTVARIWMISGSFLYVLIKDDKYNIGKFQSWIPDMWKLDDLVTMLKMGTAQLIKDSKSRKGNIEIK